MGKARKISLKTRKFEKAGDATAFFAAILNQYEIGDRVSLDDAADLSALLERHADRDEKVGNGVVAFEVNVPPDDVPQFSKRCFWIVRADGSKIDFSVGHCLKAQPYD